MAETKAKLVTDPDFIEILEKISIKPKVQKELKLDEYFLGFRRIPGTYNECWRWNE